MIAALALALPVLGTPHEAPGLVAVCARPFELDLASARRLCPDPHKRLTLRIGSVAPGSDPLATLGAPGPVLVLDPTRPHAGDDRELARRLESATCIVLDGGTWLEWWLALRPYGKRSELGNALLSAHEHGVSVIGVGPAGAHLVESALLARTTLDRPARDPHDRSRDIVVGGLGLARGAILDFATDGRDTPERLLSAALDARADLAVWLAGNCAWIQDERARTAVVAAEDGAAWVFDPSTARRSRERVEGLDLARLADGGRFSFATHRVDSPTRAKPERMVQNRVPSSIGEFFAEGNVEMADFLGKVGELAGEESVLRFVHDAPRDPLRGLQTDANTLRVRIDHARLVR